MTRLLTPRKKIMLLAAMLEDYPDFRITGYVVDAFVSSYCLLGGIYKSVSHCDGAPLLTEEISKVIEFKNRYLIETVNGERWCVANFHPHGGRRTLKFLISLFESGAMTGSRYCVH